MLIFTKCKHFLVDQKFDEEELSQRKPFAGQLYKYTNVVKGWQHRWFLINDRTKLFEYFMVSLTIDFGS